MYDGLYLLFDVGVEQGEFSPPGYRPLIYKTRSFRELGILDLERIR